ncbi:MAG: hypothetical protein KJ597_02350 [Nanoarchaeota archaeon]|nr:hypothetical protein [Nanoarchaeota archaeon]MBU1622391.1 hypothetical protein [Nanoarchaeota archaeon]
MFDFLKKLFQKEEPITSEEIKSLELDAWLKHKLSQSEFNQEIINYFNQLKENKTKLKDKIKILSEAEIDPKERDKIEAKVKNIVVGHRNNYVNLMTIFIDNLDFPIEQNLEQAIKFSSTLNKDLDDLAKRTAKSYQATQHLFFNPVEDAFKTMGEINLLTKNFEQKLEQRGLKRVTDIQEKIALLEEENRKKERLEKELRWKETKLNRSVIGKKNKEEEIEKLKISGDYQELTQLKEKENEIRGLITENRGEVATFFSKLGRALRKYEKITLIPHLVKNYLEDPVQSFFVDPDLKVLTLLENLGKSLEKDELVLDEKQKHNALQLIAQAKEGYLKQLFEKDLQLREQENQLNSKLRKINVGKSLEEAEYKLAHFSEQLGIVQKEISDFNLKLGSYQKESSELEEEIVKLVKEILRVKIKFI